MDESSAKNRFAALYTRNLLLRFPCSFLTGSSPRHGPVDWLHGSSEVDVGLSILICPECFALRTSKRPEIEFCAGTKPKTEWRARLNHGTHLRGVAAKRALLAEDVEVSQISETLDER